MELRNIEVPFCPKSDVRLVIIDGRTPENILERLSSFNIQFIKTNICTSVYDSISSHPDIQIHPIGTGLFVSCKESFEFFRENLSPYGCNVLSGLTPLKSNYPYDIAYNVARIGNLSLHQTTYTDPKIREQFVLNKIKEINVKQGYSKCSTTILSGCAIITSDRGIYKAAIENGIDSLLISSGHVKLQGHPYGFLGGCTGLISERKLAITGSLEHHPNFYEICSFLDKHEIESVFLSKDIPVDIGSIIPILEINN